MVGALTPIAMLVGGLIAAMAAYSYIKLGVYYKDEGATTQIEQIFFIASIYLLLTLGAWLYSKHS